MCFIDLSHEITSAMTVYPGFPEPRIGVYLSHEDSRSHYDGKAEFLINEIEFVCSIGTYLDAPSHRHKGMSSINQLALHKLAGLPGVVVDGRRNQNGSVDIDADDLDGKAVLVRTGWDSKWMTDEYWKSPPYLSDETVKKLIERGAALVGVDWGNVDNTGNPERPAHTRLLENEILIVENMRNLAGLDGDFRFYAIPLRIDTASFPIRAFAQLENL
ncbi:cyclase family protein [Candidatus Bathyarchaeota archaeon]|jgi:arylformamidase|nr:cyclase family protein [Candidatus Bathyarchaeota archaeon]MBT4321181.1 cyclase family protein [Candidatus Bathyarchaeota archaeon]MBT4423666.1 cyclase family protein [Candidatus Bathyarchaeota archaeon]MBT5642162.1 cyclase family protein [Candidatus Bathyarchaeota archaeon]MBT6605365.1 cyclase family protein [Candidatus Bathyarchaeota archaeon]